VTASQASSGRVARPSVFYSGRYRTDGASPTRGEGRVRESSSPIRPGAIRLRNEVRTTRGLLLALAFLRWLRWRSNRGGYEFFDPGMSATRCAWRSWSPSPGRRSRWASPSCWARECRWPTPGPVVFLVLVAKPNRAVSPAERVTAGTKRDRTTIRKRHLRPPVDRGWRADKADQDQDQAL